MTPRLENSGWIFNLSIFDSMFLSKAQYFWTFWSFSVNSAESLRQYIELSHTSSSCSPIFLQKLWLRWKPENFSAFGQLDRCCHNKGNLFPHTGLEIAWKMWKQHGKTPFCYRLVFESGRTIFRSVSPRKKFVNQAFLVFQRFIGYWNIFNFQLFSTVSFLF